MRHLKSLILFLVCSISIVYPLFVFASTNISAATSSHWAWNDLIGWIDWYNTDTITVTSQQLTGYAASSVGDISLDCATTRTGNICAQSNYKVTNDGVGNLSGWGWSDVYGWVSFDCNNYGGCSQSQYRVYIDASGNFYNYAWNDVIGWVSFNCLDLGSSFCNSISQYKVVTSWGPTSTIGVLDSTIYDTGIVGGAAFHSLMWHGNRPSGTSVRFQLATSNNASGTWVFVGPDGTSSTYYPASGSSGDPDISIQLDSRTHNNNRYFRYRVILVSNIAQTLGPRVDSVIVVWSP